MKTTATNVFRVTAALLASVWSWPVVAQDVDLFIDNLANKTGGAANVIIVIDTASANNSTMNTTCGGGTTKKLETELCVLKKMFSTPAGDGSETDTALNGISVALVVNTPSTASKGGYVHYAMRSMSEQTNRDSIVTALGTVTNYNGAPFGLALMEAYLYAAGQKPYAGTEATVPYDTAAVDAGSGVYVKPKAECQKTFVIYIGNGSPDAGSDNNLPTEFAARVGTMPADLTSPWTTSKSQMDEVAKYLHESIDLDPDTEGAQTITTWAMVANTGSNPEMTPSAIAGREIYKSAATHGSGTAISPDKLVPYTEFKDDSTLSKALLEAFKKVTAVNSVFAAVSLPVSVNVRGTYINQVYMGAFRPDADACPYWVGNLKQYELAIDSAGAPYLVDANGNEVENTGSGFVNPSAQSFWSASSSFWSFLLKGDVNYGLSGGSDTPDGEVVEKGGAAQWLRTKFASSLAARNAYTCMSINCGTGDKLSSTPFDTSNSALTAALFGAADDTEKDNIINWIRGVDNYKDENKNTKYDDVRAYLHGDVLHSRPVIVNYDRYGDDNDIGVFYGSNDGMLHAIIGGRVASGARQGGTEYWSFVPEDFFKDFKRLRDETPDVKSSSGKPYFVDGSITTSGVPGTDNIRIYATMRRGGRFMYALDVTDPSKPLFQWKADKDTTGYSNLGQTWSAPTAHTINASSNPVILMGAGYDPDAEDSLPQKSVTLGKGIMAIDSVTGKVLWQVGKTATGADVNLVEDKMDYGFPSDVLAFDRDFDGKVDRAYAVDTGANIWRIDLDDPDPANWKVHLFASLRSSGTQADERKFLYPADVVPSGDPGGAQPFDAVLIGSGDREKPFDTTVVNRFYMLRDTNIGKTVDEVNFATITEDDLYDVTSVTTSTIDYSVLNDATNKGWYFTLEGYNPKTKTKSPGEKVVGGVVTLGGTVYFGTNIPTPKTPGVTICNSLGTALLYKVNFETGLPADPTLGSRSSEIPGGGLLPSPVAAVTIINGQPVEAVVVGTHTELPPGQPVGKRQKTFWHDHRDK